MINQNDPPKSFSYALEKEYYSREWPTEAKPYRHLEPYIRSLIDPELVFCGKRILDIGAGECDYTRLIAERFEPKEAVACELFPNRMLPALGANRCLNLKFVAGDAFSLPFQRDTFDVVWGSGILTSLPNLEASLFEIRRVLKKNGLYIGFEPNPFNAVIAYRYFFKPHSRNQYLFWPWRARSAFEKVGFEVTFRYFYVKLPRIQNQFVGTCMGIMAKPFGVGGSC